MTDELPAIDDLADTDDLEAVLQAMQGRINTLEGQVKALKQSRPALVDRLDDHDARLKDIGGHVELVEGTMNTPEQGKLQKILDILDYAESQASRGPSGMKVKTGEAAAASGAGRNTALRLMDEIAATFDWAAVENPGGPNPKQLTIDLKGTNVETLKADVRNQYQEEAVT